MHRTCVKCGDMNLRATGEPMEACPACGAIYSKAKPAAVRKQAAAAAAAHLKPITSVLLAGAILWAVSPLWRAKDRAVDDARERYAIVKKGGTAMDVCVQAGLVSTALLNAKREDEYTAWKAVEKADCAKASWFR